MSEKRVAANNYLRQAIGIPPEHFQMYSSFEGKDTEAIDAFLRERGNSNNHMETRTKGFRALINQFLFDLRIAEPKGDFVATEEQIKTMRERLEEANLTEGETRVKGLPGEDTLFSFYHSMKNFTDIRCSYLEDYEKRFSTKQQLTVLLLQIKNTYIRNRLMIPNELTTVENVELFLQEVGGHSEGLYIFDPFDSVARAAFQTGASYAEFMEVLNDVKEMLDEEEMLDDEKEMSNDTKDLCKEYENTEKSVKSGSRTKAYMDNFNEITALQEDPSPTSYTYLAFFKGNKDEYSRIRVTRMNWMRSVLGVKGKDNFTKKAQEVIMFFAGKKQELKGLTRRTADEKRRTEREYEKFLKKHEITENMDEIKKIGERNYYKSIYRLMLDEGVLPSHEQRRKIDKRFEKCDYKRVRSYLAETLTYESRDAIITNRKLLMLERSVFRGMIEGKRPLSKEAIIVLLLFFLRLDDVKERYLESVDENASAKVLATTLFFRLNKRFEASGISSLHVTGSHIEHLLILAVCSQMSKLSKGEVLPEYPFREFLVGAEH